MYYIPLRLKEGNAAMIKYRKYFRKSNITLELKALGGD
jgi:hypothetical protein